jgi:hypothetical protein
MEEQAKRVAKEAANALKQSVSSQDPFAPTWTGSNETNPGRFGTPRVAANFRASEYKPPAAALVASGPVSLSILLASLSSSSLLASLQQRNSASETGGKNEAPTEKRRWNTRNC